MSNHELNVIWPAYFVALKEQREIRKSFEGSVPAEQFNAEMQRGRQ